MPRRLKNADAKQIAAEEALLRALGERLASARLAARLTQEDLADACGVSARYVQQLEAGEGNPSYLRLVAMARKLGRHGKTLLSLP